jgi:glycosyltransferase involved in cell wall biosynthesis
MHVTIVYPSLLTVPPRTYGGGERVMAWLARALVELGHRVTLIAPAGSHIPGVELRPLRWRATGPSDWHRLVPPDTDLLHLRHTPVEPPPRPYVVTLGGYRPAHERLDRNTIFLSRQHAALHGSRHYVHNGLDPQDYSCAETRDDYAVFLAKARKPEKNLAGAIEACRRAKLPLHVIGSRDWPLGLHRLLPPIRGVYYHGRLGQREKCPLLARARCLIFPVRWHEPFGNAVTEALASGCYVVATPYGSLPEIVTAQEGVLSTRLAEMVAALQSPQRFSPARCRARVVTGGFTHLDMARKYLACYEKVLATGCLADPGEPPPRRVEGFDPFTLLPWGED